MSREILMVAEPGRHRFPRPAWKTVFVKAADFFANERLVRRHDEILWQAFHTHGKYLQKICQAAYFAVALDRRGTFLASAFVIDTVEIWLLEYVMADPDVQGRGAGTAVMSRIMQEAKKRKTAWVVLHCDADKNQGQLPAFYAKFGFQRVRTPLTQDQAPLAATLNNQHQNG